MFRRTLYVGGAWGLPIRTTSPAPPHLKFWRFDMKKKLKILFCTLIISLLSVTSVLAAMTVDPTALFNPGIIYTLNIQKQSTTMTPQIEGLFVEKITTMNRSENAFWLFPGWGYLSVDPVLNAGGTDFDNVLTYCPASGGPIFLHKALLTLPINNIVINIFSMYGVNVVKVSGDGFSEVTVLDKTTGGIKFSGYISNTSSVAGHLVTYQYNPTGLPPAPVGTKVIFTLPSYDITHKLVNYSFSTYASIPLANVGDTADMFTKSVQGVTNVKVTQDITNMKVDGYGQVWAEIFYSFTADTAIGANNLIYSVNYRNFDYQGFRTYTRIEGVVDANNDGIDDRTGVAIDISNPPTGIAPVRTNYEDGVFGSISYGIDTLGYYITAPFVFIGNVITDILEWLAGATVWISQISAFLSAIFGFLPPEILAGMIAIFSVTVVFTILRIIRG